MKKAAFLTLFLIYNGVFAQTNFQGIATYESKTDMKAMNITFPGMDEGQQAKIREKMAKAFEKTFELQFTTAESIYLEPQKLEMTAKSSVFVKSTKDGVIYKNLKEKIALSESNLMDKEFLVSEKLLEYNWQIFNETKTIGSYSCQKAISVTPVSEEEKQVYEAELKKQESNATNLLTVEKPKEKITTVWFTTEIPIANGPENYWGLPGLILEANDGRTVLLCSKIVLNPKDKFEIKRPKKGKLITREAFNTIQEEKLESMKDGNGVIQLNVMQKN